MNDWSRLAVDPRRCKNSRPKNELRRTHIRYRQECKGRAPVRNRELKRPPSGGSRGQLRLSLTNTYHEWLVLGRRRGGAPRRRRERLYCSGDPRKRVRNPALATGSDCALLPRFDI